MERPTTSSKFSKIAKRLETLPPELINSIIAKMQLYNILELLLATDASSTLFWVIKESPYWAWVWSRENEFMRLQHVYETLQQLSYLCFNKSIIEGMTIFGHYLYTNFKCLRSYSKPYGYGYWREILTDLNTGCLSIFSQLLEPLDANPVPGQLEALILFMPEDIARIVDELVHNPRPERSWSMCLNNILSDDHVRQTAASIREKSWDITSIRRFLPHIVRALELLFEARSAELKRLAKLYEQYPLLLKEPFAPQTPRKNPRHVLNRLFYDSKLALKPTVRGCNKLRRFQRSSYRFKYPHPALVPYDWCFELFQLATKEQSQAEIVFPEELRPHVHRCKQGFSRIYELAGTPGCARLQLLSHIDYRGHSHEFLPHSEKELEWLESFMRCITWIRSNLDAVGIDPKSIVNIYYPDRPQASHPKVLLDAGDYKQFLENASTDMIVRQLHADSRIGDDPNASQLPSLLTLYLPSWPSPQAKEIARAISLGLSDDIARIMYEDMVTKARHEIAKPRIAIKTSLINDVLTADGGNFQGRSDPKEDGSSSWRDTLRKHENETSRLNGPPRRFCYICQRILKTPHNVFSSMCVPCGEFNLAGSSLSQPENLDLAGKTALVTGARINLGYHIALRLLRCGARVIASTRYPEDAYARYTREQDSLEWLDRLRIVGADFRLATDAFNLVKETKRILAEWSVSLDILINNAAQTLTDSIEKERKAIKNENRLAIQNGAENSTILRDLYIPRVRGITTNKSIDRDIEIRTHSTPSEENVQLSQFTDPNTQPITKSSKPETPSTTQASSWVQSLSEIPYEDIISAQSVNTLVPLILIRELTPLMGQPNPTTTTRPLAHIINVSSREGLFEASTQTRAKNGKHVHTNISKAGLNMITETEARSTWSQRRVAMNTVDPGYMSAAPEIEEVLAGAGAERPIGWEDGAGRVLWPVAIAEDRSVAPVWGVFLKHYGACRVDVRWGMDRPAL